MRAVADASDHEAREAMLWAATLAGVAFGNAGVHLPHAMSYAVAGLARGFTLAGYPDDAPLIPHGLSVILNAPAVFRWTAETSPDRHLEAARALGAELDDLWPGDVGAALSAHLLALVRKVGVPDSLRAVGMAVGSGGYGAPRAASKRSRIAARSTARGALSVRRVCTMAPSVRASRSPAP